MSARRRNMQRYNAIRSARVIAMTELLKDLDIVGATEIWQLGVKDGSMLKDEINSYRAMKIARLFGVKISKSIAIEFSKPKSHKYNLTCKQVISYIESNKEEFNNYWQWYEQPALLKAKEEFK